MTVFARASRRGLVAAALALGLSSGYGTDLNAQTPRKGGTFIMGMEGEPGSLTGHLATDTTALMVATNIFNGLVGIDFKFEPVPDLADSWTLSADGLTYTFRLNPRAKWHDGQIGRAHV